MSSTNRSSHIPPSWQVDLTIDVAVARQWRASSAVEPAVRDMLPASPRPSLVSIRFGSKRIPVKSFLFPQSAGDLQSESSPQQQSRAAVAVHAQPNDASRRKTRTRIHPPDDVIKLEDRLFFVLQPPLEMLLAGGSVDLPFRPFGFQLDGIAFLYPRFSAILADEMGLGKTMQSITAMRLLLRSGQIARVLLVCPKPLVTNWQREFALWAPEIPVAVVQGDRRRRDWCWKSEEIPVKIANYELLLRDEDLLKQDELKFDLVILDEAQRIKNRSSSTSQVVRSLSRRRSWALTGTPVENSAEDLVGIFEFIAPGYLRTGMGPRRLRSAVRDFVLRREKDQVLTDLPPKLFRDAQVELTPAQREAYRLAEQRGILRLTDMGEEITIQHVFELILRLKQICNFDPVTGHSSKLDRLCADLEEISASGHQALVFSQWVNSLKILRSRLSHFRPLEFHGKVPPGQRQQVLERFRHDSNHRVLLISYGAGGVGLNLEFVNYVFLFDRWWNPAVEDQATSRAHRIGSKGQVTVTRFATLETIEQRIEEILSDKRELFASIFSGAQGPRNLGLSQQEIFGLFDLRIPDSPGKEAA